MSELPFVLSLTHDERGEHNKIFPSILSSEIDTSIFQTISEENRGFITYEGKINEDTFDNPKRISESHETLKGYFNNHDWIDKITCLFPAFEDNDDEIEDNFGEGHWRVNTWVTIEAFRVLKGNEEFLKRVTGRIPCNFDYANSKNEKEKKKWLFKNFLWGIGIVPNLNFTPSLQGGKIPLLGILAYGLNTNGEFSFDDSGNMKDIYVKNIDNIIDTFYDIFIENNTDKIERCYKWVFSKWEDNKKRDFMKQLFTTEVFVDIKQVCPNLLKDLFSKQWSYTKIQELNCYKQEDVEKYINSFLNAVNEEIAGYEKQNTAITISGNNDDSLSIDRKLGIYSSLKNLYDRWKFGVKIKNGGETQLSIDNFVFRNSLNEDVGKKLTINLEKLSKNIISFYRNDNEIHVYSFLTNICGFVDAIMLSLPVNIYETMKDEQGIRELFTPHNTLNISKERMKTTYVITHVQKPSQYLNMGENGNDYKDDGIDFTNKHVCSGYSGGSMGVFGVTYSMGDQKYFKNIDVSMENPKVTEQSISSLLYIAENAPQNNTSKIHRSYHDLFDTYSTHSYDCTVETMGNAQLMPMMYFQLNNIPLFKGGYLITSVEHSINRSGMNTTFIGNRVNKYQFDLTNSGINNTAIFTGAESGNSERISKTKGIDEKLLKEYGKDINSSLKYSRDSTLIVLDVGHRRGTEGKESPELQYPLEGGSDDGTFLFKETIENVKAREYYNGQKMSGTEDSSYVLSPFKREKNDPTYRYREYWGNRLIAHELKKLLKDDGYIIEIASEGRKGGEKYSRSDNTNAYFYGDYNRLYEDIVTNGSVVYTVGKQEKRITSMIVVSIHSNALGYPDDKKREIPKRDENGNIIYRKKKVVNSDGKEEWITTEEPETEKVDFWVDSTNYWVIYAQKAEWDKLSGVMRYAYHPETSMKLAECIKQEVDGILSEMKTGGLPKNTIVKEVQDFSDREGPITPTTRTYAPTVLSENFFHNNSEHVKFLAKKDNRILIARAHYKGIKKFLGGD